MKIHILTVGKIENRNIQHLVDMYIKRLQHYIPTVLQSIKAEKLKNVADSQILDQEGNRLLEKMKNSDFIIVLDKSGKQQTSKEFALLFNQLAQRRIKQVTFIIGGPIGLSDKVKQQANLLLSFSKMTFPHELSAVLLTEQLYRAQSILAGEKYHK